MKTKTTLSIGFDDTDSPKGMCTTYLGFKLVNLLQQEHVEFVDYPRLVRFNPNIPWKTRGNGAVGLKIKTSNPQKIKKKVIGLIRKYSEIKNGANPAIVFYENEKISKPIKDFSKLALWKLIQRKYVKKFVKENNIDSFYIGNGQGLVGAIGVIGYEFNDNTLELLSYRKKSKFGTVRKISSQSVKNMQEVTFPNTFNSYDSKKHRVMIAPRGPDPVFCGIRGDDPDSLFEASKLIQTSEQLDGYLLFKSNQGTSDHLRHILDTENLEPYTSGIITGTILEKPLVKFGGHVFFSISTKNKTIPCAVYKESGITNRIMELDVGDKVKIGGGIRKSTKHFPRTLNVEFIQVLKLVKKYRKTNPLCQKCNKRMKSKGKNQGFECIKCKNKLDSKQTETISRNIQEKLYLPIISSQRHLTRPYQRQGKINKIKFNNSIPWFNLFKN